MRKRKIRGKWKKEDDEFMRRISKELGFVGFD